MFHKWTASSAVAVINAPSLMRNWICKTAGPEPPDDADAGVVEPGPPGEPLPELCVCRTVRNKQATMIPSTLIWLRVSSTIFFFSCPFVTPLLIVGTGKVNWVTWNSYESDINRRLPLITFLSNCTMERKRTALETIHSDFIPQGLAFKLLLMRSQMLDFTARGTRSDVLSRQKCLIFRPECIVHCSFTWIGICQTVQVQVWFRKWAEFSRQI